MTKRQAAKLDMLRSVRDIHTGSAATLIDTVLILADAFTAHSDTITMIEQLDISRAAGAAGGGPAKRAARTQCEATTLEIDGMFTAYAALIEDADLLSTVNHEPSDLRNMSDEELRAHTRALLDKAALPGMDATLLPYGLTPTKATLYEQRYDTYYALINLPDERAQQETVYGELMDAQFDAGDQRLDLIMDKLMVQFKTSNPEVWLTYTEARVINDHAGGGGSGGSGSSSSSGASSSSGSSSGGSSSSSSGSSESSMSSAGSSSSSA